MSECGRLSDRIPAVALGRAEWTAVESRHFSDCRACQEEWEVVRVASRLGQGPGGSLDTTALANRVLQQLARQRAGNRRRGRMLSWTGLASAAAIVAAVWTGGLERGTGAPPVGSISAGPPSIPLPELESLEPAELDSVWQTMDEQIVGGLTGDDPALGDLDSDELERVLDSWEG